MGTYPPHTRKNYLNRRLQRLQRVLRSAISPPGFDKPAPASQTCYWVSDTDGNWYDDRNWASSSGGTGGYGIPGATNPVVFDGQGTGKCTLEAAVNVAAISFTEAGAQVNASFDQAGYTLSCTTFTYNCANNTSPIFDGVIAVSGATFTITAAQNDAIFSSGSITTSASCTITSTDDTAVPQITAADNIIIGTTMTVARLVMSSGKNLSVTDATTLTLLAYTSGDWDALANLDSVSGATWNFVNPAGMVVSDIANVEDSNATNPVDATDNCVDGTGNTNWTFV
ncbi:MAG: hypothetical protein ACYSWO_28180 [Planctomycetota bacterium]|jgi:hypothetical protein